MDCSQLGGVPWDAELSPNDIDRSTRFAKARDGYGVESVSVIIIINISHYLTGNQWLCN